MSQELTPGERVMVEAFGIHRPRRVQLSRRKGWRKPENTVVVARPSKWGNPFAIGMSYGASGPNGEWSRSVVIRDRADAVREYRRAIEHGHPGIPSDLSELRGKDLACWCPLELPDGQRGPCHADVLLELANPEVVFPWSR